MQVTRSMARARLKDWETSTLEDGEYGRILTIKGTWLDLHFRRLLLVPV